MAVRSKRLWGPLAVPPVLTVVYTVPAGETALVKSLAIHNANAAAQGIAISLNGTAPQDRVTNIPAAGNSGIQINGLFWVFHPGDQIYVSAALGLIYMSAYGSELEGVAD